MRSLAGALAIGAVAFSAAARAGDGVVEINQARALAGGVTASDTPGFPVTIDSAGSYLLTGDLDVRGAANPQNVTAIDVSAAHVTLNLGGFTIYGPCIGASSGVGCGPTGLGSGVRSGLNAGPLRLHSGTIVGMGNRGVDVITGPASLSDLTLESNGTRGARCAGACLVERVRARQNGQEGLFLALGSRVAESAALGNVGDGIELTSRGVITDSVAVDNGGAGIRAGNALVLRTLARGNGGDGMTLGAGASITHVVVTTSGGLEVSGGVLAHNLVENACGGLLGCD